MFAVIVPYGISIGVITYIVSYQEPVSFEPSINIEDIWEFVCPVNTSRPVVGSMFKSEPTCGVWLIISYWSTIPDIKVGVKSFVEFGLDKM